MKEKIHRVRRICPCPVYDIEAVQTWLEDMAREGFLLESAGLFLNLTTFVPAAPQRVIYRLEPQTNLAWYEEPNEKPSAEVRELHTEFGWEFVCRWDRFYIYRTADPHARPLHTDAEVQNMAMSAIRRYLIIRAIWMVAYTILLNFMRSMPFIYVFRNAMVLGPWFTISYVLYFVWFGLSCLSSLIHVILYQHRLRKGKPINVRKNWKAASFFHRLNSAVPYILLLTIILTSVSGLVTYAAATSISEYHGDIPFVTIADLLPEGDYTPNENQFDDDDNTVRIWSNLVCPVNYEWDEYATVTAPDGQKVSGFLYIQYHETCGAWFAEGLADNYYDYASRTVYTDMELLDAPAANVDRLQIFEKDLYVHILIRQGDVVIHAQIMTLQDQDQADLEYKWLELMLNMLEN